MALARPAMVAVNAANSTFYSVLRAASVKVIIETSDAILPLYS